MSSSLNEYLTLITTDFIEYIKNKKTTHNGEKWVNVWKDIESSFVVPIYTYEATNEVNNPIKIVSIMEFDKEDNKFDYDKLIGSQLNTYLKDNTNFNNINFNNIEIFFDNDGLVKLKTYDYDFKKIDQSNVISTLDQQHTYYDYYQRYLYLKELSEDTSFGTTYTSEITDNIKLNAIKKLIYVIFEIDKYKCQSFVKILKNYYLMGLLEISNNIKYLLINHYKYYFITNLTTLINNDSNGTNSKLELFLKNILNVYLSSSVPNIDINNTINYVLHLYGKNTTGPNFISLTKTGSITVSNTINLDNQNIKIMNDFTPTTTTTTAPVSTTPAACDYAWNTAACDATSGTFTASTCISSGSTNIPWTSDLCKTAATSEGATYNNSFTSASTGIPATCGYTWNKVSCDEGSGTFTGSTCISSGSTDIPWTSNLCEIALPSGGTFEDRISLIKNYPINNKLFIAKKNATDITDKNSTDYILTNNLFINSIQDTHKVFLLTKLKNYIDKIKELPVFINDKNLIDEFYNKLDEIIKIYNIYKNTIELNQINGIIVINNNTVNPSNNKISDSEKYKPILTSIRDKNKSVTENKKTANMKNIELINISDNNLFIYFTIMLLICISLLIVFIDNNKKDLKIQYSIIILIFLLLYYMIYSNYEYTFEKFTSTESHSFIEAKENISILTRKILPKLVYTIDEKSDYITTALNREEIKYDNYDALSSKYIHNIDIEINDKYLNHIKNKEFTKFLILLITIIVVIYIFNIVLKNMKATVVISLVLFIPIYILYLYNINLISQTKYTTKYWNHKYNMKKLN